MTKKSLIQRAAAGSGRTETIRLTPAEQTAFALGLREARAPSQRLRQAVDRFKQQQLQQRGG